MRLVSCLLAAGLLSGGASAGDMPATFAGLVLSTCVLTAGTAGVLTNNSSFNDLASTNAGGARSTVVALTTGTGFKISALAPSSFVTGDSTSVTFSADYNLNGVTTASGVAGATQTTLNLGTTTVSVGLDAQKSSGNFSAGAYSAIVTVRCE